MRRRFEKDEDPSNPRLTLLRGGSALTRRHIEPRLVARGILPVLVMCRGEIRGDGGERKAETRGMEGSWDEGLNLSRKSQQPNHTVHPEA